MKGEVNAILSGRMAEQPEFDNAAGIGIVQIHFTHDLEGLGRHLSRAGYQAVNHFQAVNVRLMLQMPAEGVENGRAQEGED